MLVFCLLAGTAPEAFAQQTVLSQPVSVSFHHTAADSALHLLEKATGYNLTYNARFVPQNRYMDAFFKSVPFGVILDSIFANPLLQYKQIGRQVVVFLPQDKRLFSRPEYRYTGRVVVAGTGAPLPYATAGILHRGFGVICNKEGFFAITIPEEYLKDTLMISALGYYPLKVPVSVLDSFRLFRLHQKIVSLPEILIRSLPARELVRRAILHIPDHYDANAFTFGGFYREEVKKNRQYMSYTEALLQIYKKPMRPTLYHDQVKVLKMRKYTNITTKDSVLFKLQGGLQAVLSLDLIRRQPGFLSAGQMNRFVYALQNMTVLDNRLLYVVSFSPRNENVLPAVTGTLYIDATSLAIVRIVFHYERKSLRKNRVQYVLKKRGHVQAFPVWAEYRVSYQRYQGRYYIQYVLGNIRFKVKRQKHWLRSTYTLSFEIMRTNINNKNPGRFAANETLPPGKIFSDQKTGYDVSYWHKANILVPEADIQQALKGFRKEVLGIKK